jgi:hypothetical protein
MFFLFLFYTASFVQNPSCAARGHALAVFHILAKSALAPVRAPLGGQMRSAPRNNNITVRHFQ